MKHIKGEKTPIDELFRTIYSDALVDLIADIEIVEIVESNQDNGILNADKVNKPVKHQAKDAVLIKNVELTTAGLKIGQIHLTGMLTKTLIVLAVIALLYPLVEKF